MAGKDEENVVQTLPEDVVQIEALSILSPAAIMIFHVTPDTCLFLF